MPFNFLNQGQTDDAATKFQPIDTFIDPVSKIRVSNPANLIDTDFEYGLQPTKWETVEIINNTPAFFSKSGDTTISDITGITTNGGTREITVTTAFPHLLDVGIPIRVSGTKSVTADGSYIINATPTSTTFTYLARANQPETISIFDLYSSIITGEFFQGSQISISDAEGMTTDGVGPNSTITIKTANKHGFGPKTPFYFLNLNSTVSQEFESTNSTSLSFDPSNSATAQSFDGSNTLLQTPVDLSNSATTSEFESTITSTNATNATVTVSIPSGDQDNWGNLVNGSPLYYDVNIGSGYFQANPRGVVFIKDVSLIDAANGTATFQVSQLPDSDALPILANMTGYFQIADQARTFAGNNVNPSTQIDLVVEEGQEFVFDGGNQGYDGDSPDVFEGTPPNNTSTVVGYTGTTISVFTAEGALDYYVGTMLLFETTGDAPSGLSNNTTYFVTSFEDGPSAGLYNMKVAALPGGPDITISGGTGTQTFSRIGVSLDKDIVHVKNSAFQEGDMLEYTYPVDGTSGNFGADFEQKFYFVETAYDSHNYKLSEDTGFKAIDATGGNIITEFDSEGRTWKIHAFTSTGSQDFTVNSIGSDGLVEALVVAGGGGGGSHVPGGGGAGGLVYLEDILVEPQTYSIVVGAGGAGSYNPGGYGGMPNATTGDNSSAFGATALGGGFGGSWTQDTRSNNGGSGGGRNTDRNSGQRIGLQPQQSGLSQGFGGNGALNNQPGQSNYGSGGGGGAGETPPNASNRNVSGRGGDGLYYGNKFSDSFGENGWFAGGGEGGGWGNVSLSRGGIGGGGDGDCPTGNGSGSSKRRGSGEPRGYDGLANTGGGGGGAGRTGGESSRGGDGGSGVVLIRYPITEIPIAGIVASGGVEEDIIDGRVIYRLHKFESVGTDTFSITDIEKPDLAELEYLVVAGGGGGGAWVGGGGGAGGYLEGKVAVDQIQNFDVQVGAGGRGEINPGGYSGMPYGRSGENSSIAGVATAIGGGRGGSWEPYPPQSGGSGGGEGYSRNGASGTAGQGFAGGRGRGSSDNGYPTGGGGGASEVGENWTSAKSGDGGDGKSSSITGTSKFYAGGGGGGVHGSSNNAAGGQGGQGGGGFGRVATGTKAQNGTPNTGGGGGGSGRNGGERSEGGDGGSGVVYIRYLIGINEA